MIADEFEQLAQPHRLRRIGELGGRTDRKIDQQMGRAGRELFRHDRGDHLLARIEAERPLDRDQDVVGRRQIDVTAPDQAAVAGCDHLLHFVDPEIDAGQHLHGVGGAGRRGDRARRCLRDREAMRGDDRHHDHRGAIARNAADAMLVDDDRRSHSICVPACAIAWDKREQFVAGHEAGRADQECGDLHVGIAIMREIIDDGADLRGAQRPALDLGAHRVEAVGRRSRRDGDQTAGRLGKAAKGRLGEAEFIGTDQTVIGDAAGSPAGPWNCGAARPG